MGGGDALKDHNRTTYQAKLTTNVVQLFEFSKNHQYENSNMFENNITSVELAMVQHGPYH